MRKLTLLLLVLSLGACVKPKLYRAEQTLRTQSEAREKVLLQELHECKQEKSSLVQQVGDLNRTIGNQESEMRDLTKELTTRTQTMGESSGKLASEKAAVESELASKNAQLQQSNAQLQRIKEAQNKRKKTLTDLAAAVNKALGVQPASGLKASIEKEEIVLILPDKNLFDATMLNVSAAGKTLITPLANFLLERPELDVDLVCYTDNVLPKDKTLKDSWDWSQQRAGNLARMLIRDFNVNANQLTPIGRGEFKPLVSNETAEGRQTNRRTEIRIKTNLAAVPVVEN